MPMTSDFPQLPGDNSPDRAATFQAVYDQLSAMGLPLPATPAATILRADLLAFLQAQAGGLIHAEIQKPAYAGLSDIDTATALNNPTGPICCPIHMVLDGYPFAPNIVTADDVKNCR